jgi:hypothetical protein
MTGWRVNGEGLGDFLTFASERPKMFRILQESYVVDPDIYFSYFESIAASYARRLKDAQKRKQIVEADSDIQAWCLIAINNFLGMRYSRPGTGKAKLNAVVEAAADFIVHGLSPEQKNQPSRSTNESKKPEQRLRLNCGEYEFYRTYRITEGSA